MISFDYRGKAALVTGAGRGLGFAIASAFHASGAIIFINDRTADTVASAIARMGGGERLIPAPADLATVAGAAGAVAPALKHGQLDILVNNAAVNIERPIEETNEDHWDMHLAIDLRAPLFTTQAALPLLEAGQGSVINIASELGLQAIPDNVAYIAAKHGLIAMTRSLAIELAPANIRVNALCPGTIDTELMQECAAASSDPEAYYRGFRAYHPIGRLASPEEIAQFVLCLASPAAAFMTGAAIAIDGGSSAEGVMAIFTGKRVLVTGSTRGIGRAAVEAFHKEGASLILHGRSEAAVADMLLALPGHIGFAADMADRAAVHALAAKAGDVDVLVNCAGIYDERPMAAIDAEFYDRMIAINFTAPWLLARALLPGLRRRQGVIVNIASDAGLLGYAGAAVYCASKGGLIGLTRALAVELAPDVRAVCVCPGPVATDMMEQTVLAAADPAVARAQWNAYPLLRRVAQPEEIAAAILFAASPANSFMTGTLIVADGGTTIGKRV